MTKGKFLYTTCYGFYEAYGYSEFYDDTRTFAELLVVSLFQAFPVQSSD